MSLNFHIIFDSQGKNEASSETKLLVENIERFRKLKGWTRKRVYLMGVASMIGTDNPDLVTQIADYIARGSYK